MVRKAVIPVAGWGTRVLPATKSIPKPILPLADLPTIHYVVEEAVAAGIEHIVMITNRYMHEVEDYFDESPELNRLLEEKGNDRMLERLNAIEAMARFSFVRQSKPRGLGHAILMAREVIGDEPFAVLLGDDLMYSPQGGTCLGELIQVFNEQDERSVLCAKPLVAEALTQKGVIAGELLAPGLTRVTGLVEKPRLGEAPSDLAVMGRYVLTPAIFPILEQTVPGRGGEIQLTDALVELLRHEPIFAHTYTGIFYDIGDTLGWLTTNIAYTLRRPDLAPGLRAFLQTLDLRD